MQSRTAVFAACRAQLLVHACRLLPSTSATTSAASPQPDQTPSSEADLAAVISLLNIYIHLRETVTQLQLTAEEYRLIRRLLMCRPQHLSLLSNQYIILTLCAFTLLPDLFADHMAEVEFVDWLKWQLAVDVQALDLVIPEVSTYRLVFAAADTVFRHKHADNINCRWDGAMYAGTCSISDVSPNFWFSSWQGGTHLEIFLLLASHLRAAHYKDVSLILSEHLGLKVSKISSAALSVMKRTRKSSLKPFTT